MAQRMNYGKRFGHTIKHHSLTFNPTRGLPKIWQYVEQPEKGSLKAVMQIAKTLSTRSNKRVKKLPTADELLNANKAKLR
jgi:hypothetical protein